jgi:hypothetical protein
MRRACDPNLWTLHIERQFNAAARMLFRNDFVWVFLACGWLTPPFQFRRPQNGTFPYDGTRQ